MSGKTEQMRSEIPVVLAVAGTDPSGGAGINVDLQVFRDLGCHGASAITAVVWQNTQAVGGWRAMEPEELGEQLEAVSTDLEVSAVKIGMLPTVELIDVVAGFIEGLDSTVSVIFDPVMASGDGRASMMDESGQRGLKRLSERVDLITPNIPEALVLVGAETGEMAPRALVEELLRRRWRRVLLKGGHLDRDGDEMVVDWYGDKSGVQALAGLKAVPWDVRGTGCQLSSAIAAERAYGMAWLQAVASARTYLNQILEEKARHIGEGRPVIVRGERRR